MIIGIDTSCYTTSAAAVGMDGKLIADVRSLLPVEKGARGVSQSQAFFSHVSQSSHILHELYGQVDKKHVKGVCASTRPRPLPGSYMPVFRAGENMGRIIADTLSVPFASTSHQEGHLAAALWSCQKELDKSFLAVHLSGGTSEILQVQKQEGGFMIDILGGSDLAAGQFVDRVGVALGLPFPAGPHLEELAASATEALKLPVSVQGCELSFSGPESAAGRLIAKGADPAALAAAVFANISEALALAIGRAAQRSGLRQVLLGGGVVANTYIRNDLAQKLAGIIEVYFAKERYAGDNAVGAALLGRELCFLKANNN